MGAVNKGQLQLGSRDSPAIVAARFAWQLERFQTAGPRAQVREGLAVVMRRVPGRWRGRTSSRDFANSWRGKTLPDHFGARRRREREETEAKRREEDANEEKERASESERGGPSFSARTLALLLLACCALWRPRSNSQRLPALLHAIGACLAMRSLAPACLSGVFFLLRAGFLFLSAKH